MCVLFLGISVLLSSKADISVNSENIGAVIKTWMLAVYKWEGSNYDNFYMR